MNASIEARSIPVPESGCWIWIGGWKKSGYGSMGGRTNKLAHRASFEAFKGPISAGMQVCHKCDTPACVNPAHLFLGTTLDNQRDSARKGRRARNRKPGSANPSAKLNLKQARAIAADPRTHKAIAADYGVSRAQVGHIKTGRRWSSEILGG